MSADDGYDEGEHSKEVYDHFGLAYYQSGVVESGIANALLYGEFLSEWKKRIEREGKANFDRKVYEAEFDAFLEKQFAQTFGNLIVRLDRVYEIPSELRAVIAECKKLRDNLAHHYFRERANDFMTRQGRDRMIKELFGMTHKFHEMDRRIEELIVPVMRKLGIRQDMLDRYTGEHIRKARAGDAN